jgi:hypothetical protein
MDGGVPLFQVNDSTHPVGRRRQCNRVPDLRPRINGGSRRVITSTGDHRATLLASVISECAPDYFAKNVPRDKEINCLVNSINKRDDFATLYMSDFVELARLLHIN